MCFEMMCVLASVQCSLGFNVDLAAVESAATPAVSISSSLLNCHTNVFLHPWHLDLDRHTHTRTHSNRQTTTHHSQYHPPGIGLPLESLPLYKI